MTPEQFQHAVLAWYDRHGRKDLPWQQDISHYRVWVSEIMLQQTQVATVMPYFHKFMQRFPDIQTLAAADADAVMQHWAGLGYYARARNLHQTAKIIVEQHQAEFPATQVEMQALPGIGRSTAAAILAIVDQQPLAILDGNVKRVLGRYAGETSWPGEKPVAERLWQLAESLTPSKRVHHYTQAMMDIGATLCTRTKPQCLLCPIHANCRARQNGDPENYPGKKPKRAYPTKQAHLLLLVADNHVLLQRRPPKGIWGGLWAPPLFDTLSDLKAWLRAENLADIELDIQPQRQHLFTHFRLHYTPVQVDLTKVQHINGYQWQDLSTANQLGVPKPVKTLLTELAINV